MISFLSVMARSQMLENLPPSTSKSVEKNIFHLKHPQFSAIPFAYQGLQNKQGTDP